MEHLDHDHEHSAHDHDHAHEHHIHEHLDHDHDHTHDHSAHDHAHEHLDHDHTHEHHDHVHDHCEDHHHHCGACAHESIELSDDQVEILTTLLTTPYLPLARFILRSSQSEEIESIAMAPVYLFDGKESLQEIRKTGDALTALEEYGLITLDYDIPLQNFDYHCFFESDVYEYFQQTAQEAKKRPGFLFDTTFVETGSIALSPMGQEVAEQMV